MSKKYFSPEESLKLLQEITKKTHNDQISPVAQGVWEKHLRPKNPLWGIITAKAFSIENKAHVIAMVDPRLPGIGLVGFFGCTSTEVGVQILNRACKWLKNEHGIKDVYGPIHGTITRDYRFNLDEDFKVPGEPVNPSFYIDAFRMAGFEIFNQYVSGMSKHYKIFNKLFVRVPSKKYSHLTLRPFGSQGQIEDLRIYHELMNEIFPSQSIYCPVISWEERYYNRADKNIVFDPNYSYFLEDGKKAIGMIIASSYENKLLISVLGVFPKYRGHHVSGLLIRKAHEQAANNGLEAALYGMIRVGNQVYRMKRPGAKIYRRYITMRKQI